MVKIFLDSATPADLERWLPTVDGVTTNPTLMRAAGFQNYLEAAKYLVDVCGPKPLSLEVIADDWREMYQQALTLSELGRSVYVKIPITNTLGRSSKKLIEDLATAGVKLNITAVMTPRQVQMAVDALRPITPSIISVFAGRIADTGRDPVPVMRTAVRLANDCKAEVLWASARESYNMTQAADAWCDIITLSPALLEKRKLQLKDLDDYSQETVQMFYDDAQAAGFRF